MSHLCESLWVIGAGAGFWSLMTGGKNYLSSLISLELVVLATSMIFFWAANCDSCWFLAGFLTFAVCESALGLSALVLFVRGEGSAFTSSSFSSLVW